jgi:hypothetical protein
MVYPTLNDAIKQTRCCTSRAIAPMLHVNKVQIAGTVGNPVTVTIK